jgi:ADP-ribose pyrophosphatase YjhB (NUDIX family)
MADAAWPRTCPRCANVSYRNPLPVAVVLIPVVEATGTGVLAIRRAVAPRAGWYALPGGFIETGESWQEAAAREVQEEAGVIIDPDRLLVHTVFSAPDDTLIIAAQSPPIQAEALPDYEGGVESSARIVLRTPRELAFPLHTRLATEFLASEA